MKLDYKVTFNNNLVTSLKKKNIYIAVSQDTIIYFARGNFLTKQT